MRNWVNYARFGVTLKRLAVLLTIAAAAIGLVMFAIPAFAVKDFKALSTATSTAEGVLLATGAAALDAAAAGTFKSLLAPSGKRITGLKSFQALAYSVHKSYTLWFLAAAKLLSSFSIALESEQLQPNYYANTLAILVWIAALASAFSSAILLLSRPQAAVKAESARAMKARGVGLLIFLLGAILAFYLSAF